MALRCILFAPGDIPKRLPVANKPEQVEFNHNPPVKFDFVHSTGICSESFSLKHSCCQGRSSALIDA